MWSMRSYDSVDDAAHHAPHLVALVQEQLGQVRAVLSGDAGDQRAGHVVGQSSSWLTRSRHQASVSASVVSIGVSGVQPVSARSRSGEP